MANGAELYDLFRRNLPHVVRNEAVARRLLADPANRVFSRRDEGGRLVAASVVHEGAIYLLCVDAPHRRRGLGSALLAESEAWMRAQGQARATLGVGEGYLMPGVPTNVPPYAERLTPGALYEDESDDAWQFFVKRGYAHAWADCNCFDMRMPLAAFSYAAHRVGDEIDGVRYRWGEVADIPAVCRCTDDAHAGFTKYYRDENQYAPDGAQRALIALDGERVCGALLVGRETEGAGLGSVGCTAVAHAYRGRHIAANMILLGTRHLRDIGMREAFLGYTYSGLDKLYGLAGYRICVYYGMGEKALAPV